MKLQRWFDVRCTTDTQPDVPVCLKHGRTDNPEQIKHTSRSVPVSQFCCRGRVVSAGERSLEHGDIRGERRLSVKPESERPCADRLISTASSKPAWISSFHLVPSLTCPGVAVVQPLSAPPQVQNIECFKGTLSSSDSSCRLGAGESNPGSLSLDVRFHLKASFSASSDNNDDSGSLNCTVLQPRYAGGLLRHGQWL
ncbi:unnamed protein product [Pleuronectes platessa]|uniref:Uncharacterized protein n=1 Tax=Pleuronectes platessa TaxID=8262 RepID=A0A9N7Y5X8_PLEPL|nr:unnamed protein product [Pleuronectes platessa]